MLTIIRAFSKSSCNLLAIVTSKITDHHDAYNSEKVSNIGRVTTMCQTQVSKCYWENGANRLAQHRVVTDLHKKNALSVKCNKMRCACTCNPHMPLLLCSAQSIESIQTDVKYQ